MGTCVPYKKPMENPAPINIFPHKGSGGIPMENLINNFQNFGLILHPRVNMLCPKFLGWAIKFNLKLQKVVSNF